MINAFFDGISNASNGKFNPKRTLFLLLLFLFSGLNSIFGQSESHYNSWSRLSISNVLSNNYRSEVEFQLRGQNDSSIANNNPFHNELMQSVRTWLHCKYGTKFTFSLSPFAYFKHAAIIYSESDKSKNHSYEIRFTLAADFKQKLISKTTFFNRLAFEFRDFKNNNNENVHRIRNKIGIKYDFNKKWNISVFDEYFINTNSPDKKHFYDHNRIGIMAGFSPVSNVKIDFGYIAINRLPKNKIETMNENNFLVMLYYTFKNKK
jgi:hypothetical protein